MKSNKIPLGHIGSGGVFNGDLLYKSKIYDDVFCQKSNTSSFCYTLIMVYGRKDGYVNGGSAKLYYVPFAVKFYPGFAVVGFLCRFVYEL